MTPALFFFLRIALAILGCLWFHINFRIICSSSVRNVMCNLIGIAPITNFGVRAGIDINASHVFAQCAGS